MATLKSIAMTVDGRYIVVNEPLRQQGKMYRSRCGAVQKPYYGMTGHTDLPCIDLPKTTRS